jgi:hypothetical protein
MTKEEFEKFRNKMVVALAILSTSILVIAFLKNTLIPYKPLPKFEVVDTYNECAIVRYTTVSNEWIYFLDCSNKK